MSSWQHWHQKNYNWEPKGFSFHEKSPNKSCAISSYQVGREKKGRTQKKGLLPIIAEIDYFCSILKHSIVA